MAKLSIRIDFEPGGRVGPGKIALLERVDATGSISAAGREIGMSYRRAWELIADLNAIFGQPLISGKIGGKHGGGSVLTPFGKSVIKRYRLIEETSRKAAGAHMRALEAALARPGTERRVLSNAAPGARKS